MAGRRLLALLCLLLFGLAPGLQAQEGLFIGAGYNQSYASLDSLNFILRRYNESRPNLNRSMKEMHLLGGLSVRAGYAGEKWIGELGFTGRRGVSKAEDSLGTNLSHWQAVRLSTATVDIGIARRLGEHFQIGASLDLGAVKAAMESNYDGNSTFLFFPPDIVRGLTLGNTIHFQAQIPLTDFLNLDIRPYYQHNWVRNDFFRLHQTLNPQTHQPDPDVILVSTGNVGLKVMLTAYIK